MVFPCPPGWGRPRMPTMPRARPDPIEPPSAPTLDRNIGRPTDAPATPARVQLIHGSCVERDAREDAMPGKAVISLTTGLEDPEKVTVALLVALGAAESGRPTLMFLAKEAVRLAVNGVAQGCACAGCQPIPWLFDRYA